MIEHEIKSIVTETVSQQYKNILDKLAISQSALHINYYFDTLDFKLYSLGNTLRIRQKGNKLLLQYKYEKNQNGLERTCKEFEKPIQSFQFCIVSEILSTDIPKPSLLYNYIGNLVTERIDYLYDDVIVSLDTNYYLGKCDHEIELEYQNVETVKKILELLSIEKIESCEMGKYNRFVKEYQTLKLIGK